MSTKLKYKKDRENNESIKRVNSLRIGISATIITIANLILDIVGIFMDTKYVSAIVAFIILISLLWIVGKKCGLKKASIKNKEYARDIIETATLSSIFGFIIERIMLPFANDIENIAITIFLSILFIMLPMIVFLILRSKKEWGYHVD